MITLISVPAFAIDWLKKHHPELCVESGLCDRGVGGRLYTRTGPAVHEKPAAFVPVHPKQGPLWANCTADPNPERMPAYPLMALYDLPPRQRWRHVKTGGIYELIVGGACMEANNQPVAVYQSVGPGRATWVRPLNEFMDGRFVREPDEPEKKSP